MAKPAAPLPDAATTNWVDRHAPAAFKPWLKLGRFDRPIGIWLLMLPGWQGIALAGAMAGDLASNWTWYGLLLVLFALGAALMRAAGCGWNDVLDRDIDAKVARTANRPIPAGQISVGQALNFIVVCCLLSLVILLHFNLTAVALGAGSLVLVGLYPLMKRITWFALLVKEKRSVGHIGPGLDVVAKVILKIAPISSSKSINPAAVNKLV